MLIKNKKILKPNHLYPIIFEKHLAFIVIKLCIVISMNLTV